MPVVLLVVRDDARPVRLQECRVYPRAAHRDPGL